MILLLLLLAITISSTETPRAQSQVAILEGAVHDLDGRPLDRVKIDARRIDTNETFTLETDSSGTYGWNSLPVGDYEVLAARDRFNSQLRKQVRLQVGQRVRLDFRLRPAPSGQPPKVEDDLSQLSLERDDVGQLIDRQRIGTMPSKERDFRDLIALAPGASSQDGRSVRVLGMSRRDNLTYVDGSLITSGDGATSLTPASEAIREFDVKTGLYSAQYGIRSGAQMLLVTRHGGNQFHGGLFWFHRNDNLDARNFFEHQQAEFKRNQMGGTLGGPLMLPGLSSGRNKAWFFLSYQHYTIRETLPLTAVVPTPDQRQGRFRSTILDPLSGEPFPDGQIPAGRINPVARQLQSFFPSPNTAGPLNFTSPDSKRPLDNPQIIARVDLRTSPESSWSGRFIWDSKPFSRAYVFNVFSTELPMASYSQAITNTRKLPGELTNFFGLHWFRRPYSAAVSRPKPEVPEQLGIPQLLESEIDRSGVPTVLIQGYTRIGDQRRLGPVNVGNWQVKDDLAFQRGRHSYQLGVEYRQGYNFFALQGRSSFDFFDRYTGDSFADFLLGHPARTSLGGEERRGSFHQNSVYSYFQDRWRVLPTLTLTLGIRYELRFPWRDKRGFMANFDPVEGALFPALLDLELGPGESGRFEHGFPLIEWRPWDGLLPRMGLALRLAGSSVLHLGYGIYANETDLSMIQGMGKNPRPGAQLLTFNAPLESPELSLSRPFPAELVDFAIPTLVGNETPTPLTRTRSWGLSLQHRWTQELILDVGYQSSRTDHRLETLSFNDAVPGVGDRQSRRPYPDLQSVLFTAALADAWYHGAFLQLEKQPGKGGLHLMGSLSWSNLIDTGGGDQGNQSSLLLRSINISPELNRGSAQSQIRKRFLLSGSYELPFGSGKKLVSRGLAARILSGWSLQGISTIQDGPSFTVFLPGDPLDTGSSYSQWPDRIRDANLPSSQRNPQRWFDTSAFVHPGGLRYGNAGRNTVKGPGLMNLDISLRRILRVRDQSTLEVRLESFNSLNRANFSVRSQDGITQFGTPEFGVLGRALPGRQLQLGLKYSF